MHLPADLLFVYLCGYIITRCTASFATQLTYGVIGSTKVSGSFSLGSSPGRSASV